MTSEVFSLSKNNKSSLDLMKVKNSVRESCIQIL